MPEMKYVFGPVPSRRMGRSLGISPIPKKTCNYSCVYCQLGRTNKMTNTRKEFFKVSDIISELKSHISSFGENYDVITIVGEGEPTIYSKLGELISEIKKITSKPVAVITNGALLYDENVRNELKNADIVLPSLDSYNEYLFKKIDRPMGCLKYDDVINGLKIFSKEYKGIIYLEIMLIDGLNDDKQSIIAFKDAIKDIRYDRLYINTPVRPPAENNIRPSSEKNIQYAVSVLGGISIDMLASGTFSSDIIDDYEAILSIISRHPMNRFELSSFINSRKGANLSSLIQRLENDPKVDIKDYKGYFTYRLK